MVLLNNILIKKLRPIKIPIPSMDSNDTYFFEKKKYYASFFLFRIQFIITFFLDIPVG